MGEVRQINYPVYFNDVVSFRGTVGSTGRGTVTQITSITTGVTLNTSTGSITTVSSTLAAGAEASFVVTNSKVAATDTVAVCVGSTSSAGLPAAVVTAVGAGAFTVTLTNLDGAAALNNTVTVNFAVIKSS